MQYRSCVQNHRKTLSAKCLVAANKIQYLGRLDLPKFSLSNYKQGTYMQESPASARAFRCAIASIEIMGLTPDALGNDDPSITKKFRASQVSPSGLVAEFFGDPPSRALPMM